MQWALGSGHIAIMAWLLERGLSVDARNDNGTTSLMNAVQFNNLEAIAWLLDQGADPNAADDRGFTSLHRAAEAGFTEIVHLLLQKGAALSPIAQGQTPLSLAEASGHSEIIGLLGR
jgi:ankyrin repeat protein